MARYFPVWISCGILPPLLLVVGAIECTQKENLLKEISHVLTRPSDCLMECTGLTYTRKLELQDNRNIRLKDSTEGDLGEYCWSMDLQCTIGESFQYAYVVLPVDMSVVGHEQLQLKSTAPTVGTLGAHYSPTTLANNCGLRYDVTNHFDTEQTEATFCVQIVTQQNLQADSVLRCPPFLVSFWQRSPNQFKQEGGG